MEPVPSWPILRYGATGNNVTALQLLLTYHGYGTSADGIFGDNTRSCVIRFQTAKGLSPDGEAGPNTLSNMVVTVYSGYSGYAARAAQYLLRKFYPNLAADGVFGSNSVSATRAFQNKMGISVGDAVYPQTWRYLFGYNAFPSAWYGRNSELTDYEMKVNASYIYNYLISRGWTKNAICGMLGNMELESKINPGAWQDYNTNNRGGFGIVQWTANADTNYENLMIRWANDNGLDPTLLDVQLQRIIYEEANGLQYYGVVEPFSFSDFKVSTMTAHKLARAFAKNYERPGDQSDAALDTRGNYATKWYNYLP